MTTGESALLVLVGGAEALVKPFRDRYDGVAVLGMPAHVTLLYPFKPSDLIDDALLGELRAVFASLARFRFALRSIRRFPQVLYLAPEPAEAFRELTLAIWRRYPELPPNGGKWPDIVPHLSVANLDDERDLDRIADEFARMSTSHLPIDAAATEVALMDNRGERWQIRATFALGQA